MRNLFLATVLALTAVWFDSSARNIIDLSGRWNLSFDGKSFRSEVSLPGTLDTNGKGNPVGDNQNTNQLSRLFTYEGPAYYSRYVTIPDEWKDCNVSLMLERTRPSTVWVDGKRVGSVTYLSAPHVYDLTDMLTPGKHQITVMVDNRDSIPHQIRSNSHACTESTQTNWNGVVGRIELQSKPKCHIASLDAYPDVDSRSFKVVVDLSTPPARKGKLRISSGSKSVNVKLVPSQSHYEATLSLGDTARLWSDRSPALHVVSAIIPKVDTLSVKAGLRKIDIKGMQFAVNDTVTFLRGRHDACVFPLTGFAPMDVESWRSYFRTIKNYGLNHVRFHSWCPPEACFEAADMEGIYLQPELTIWGTFSKDEKVLMDYLLADGDAIHREYSRHPSFALFSLGNELWGELDMMREFSDHFRSYENRHYYAFGSNSHLGWKGNLEGQDFSVTCRVGGGEGYSTHTRASFSFADAPEGGYLNNTYPNTEMNFEKAVLLSDVPVIGHETGQYQIYPNYGEMKKYTGVLRPTNMEIFRQRLEKAGMLDRADDFFKASGKWSAELYKADMEMNLRTPSMAGFQLLDIQDYPGQGTALVGILDAFMDSKGLIEPSEWRNSCAPVVALAEFPTYCVVGGSQWPVSFAVANYGSRSLEGEKLNWALRDGGKVIAEGSAAVPDGFGLLKVDSTMVNVPNLEKAAQLRLDLALSGSDVVNSYKIWSYPNNRDIEYGDVHVARKLSDDVVARLQRGEKVLLAPLHADVDSVTVGGLFQTDYWNYRMFRTICENNKAPVSPGTLGIIADASHPALAEFPNDGHSDWQWYAIVKNSYPLILDRLNDINYRPVVQVIDNVERNHRLGLVAEFSVEGGKLLMLMADMDKLCDKPEGQQFVKSLVDYMNTSDFNPSTSMKADELITLLTEAAGGASITTLRNISYD